MGAFVIRKMGCLTFSLNQSLDRIDQDFDVEGESSRRNLESLFLFRKDVKIYHVDIWGM